MLVGWRLSLLCFEVGRVVERAAWNLDGHKRLGWVVLSKNSEGPLNLLYPTGEFVDEWPRQRRIARV